MRPYRTLKLVGGGNSIRFLQNLRNEDDHMKAKKLFKRIISFLLVLSMMTSFVGSSWGKDGSSDMEVIPSDSDAIVINDVSINDSFVALEIKGIEEAGITVDEIDIDEILVHCIEVKNIDSIEIEVTSINDEFVYVAYKNFVSYYGDDFDLKDFLIDAGIGCGCILIYVTLSVAGGPVGTFFGAVITSQFTTSAIVISAAIDAAVSAYQAYEEGGDASYIIGHMLNGVADGFKWSAMLAPLTGAVDGIKALRAVSALRKVPGFEEITDKQARKIFEEMAKILEKSTKLGDDFTDEALKKLYESLSEDFTEEVSEKLFREILSNRQALTDIVKKFNPFNVSRKVVKALQDDFIKKSGMADDAIVKAIKKGTIKNIDDIADDAVREYIEKHMYEYISCFGESISKDFMDSCMRKSMGDEAFELIKKSITSNDLYVDLVNKIGRLSAENLLSDSNTLALMQLRYGAGNVNKLLYASVLYRQLQRSGNSIAEEDLRMVMSGIMDGSFKSLDDIYAIRSTIANNLCSSREVVANTIKGLGNEKALSGLLDDMVRVGFEDLDFAADFADDIVSNTLSKTDIVAKYGDSVYQSLITNYNQTVSCLYMKTSVNYGLIEDLTRDALKAEGLQDDIIIGIMSGKGITEWGLTNKQIMEIYNVVSDYYRVTDERIYANYITELAEVRGEYISDFMATYTQDNTVRNIKYAGSIMEPGNSNAAKATYIKEKYGDIYMSSQGFPVFDDYAVARVEISDLTGLDNGADDIAKANLAHHGNETSIPGYTWHHIEDGKTLILIPSDLHDAYQHTGGAALLRNGLKEAI